MSRMPTALRRSILIAAAGTLAATTIAGVAPAQTTTGAGEALVPAAPVLRLDNATDKVTLQRYGQRVELDIGIYAIAGDEDFLIEAHRPSWYRPISAELIRSGGNVALPEDSFREFKKMAKFFSLTFTDRKTGATVVTKTYGFCPAGNAVRIDPDASQPTKAYPSYCPYSPFTRGGVYGISRGYGIQALGDYGRPMRIGLGNYKATLTINPPYADLFGLAPEDSTASVKVDVVKNNGSVCKTGSARYGCKTATRNSRTGASTAATGSDRVPREPSARPTGPDQAAPTPAVLPDLQSLPATAINLRRGYVSFAATVWNAGPSPLVVDGFRRKGEDIMDAYQYYYDVDGNEVGHEAAGTMEWDPRHGHTHWHFLDFARYRLLDADKHAVVRSRKEAFCLANTDAVDYTVDGANWNPYNTDLHTSCGGYASMAVREVLDTGSGDTYFQGLPGQSFNVKNLPNGKYFISVEANPFGVIHETKTTNNNSYRKIFIWGKGDNRRVIVPQKGVIDDKNYY